MEDNTRKNNLQEEELMRELIRSENSSIRV